MGKKQAKDEFDGMGATSKRDTWRPPKNLKKHKCEDKVWRFYLQKTIIFIFNRLAKRSLGLFSSKSFVCLRNVFWTTCDRR